MLDPSNQAHAKAAERLRAEPVAWLTTVRADGQAQSTPVWFLWDGDTFLLYSQPDAQHVRNVTALGYEPGPFARTYSTPIRVRPTRVRVW